MAIGAREWADVLAAVTDRSHLVTGDRLSALVDAVVRPVGLGAQVLVVDLAQRGLREIGTGDAEPLGIDGTLAGRAYQFGEIVTSTDAEGARLLWMPMLDGTERLGVLRLVLDDEVVDDTAFRSRCLSLAGLTGHLVMTKLAYSDQLRRLRSGRELSPASELLWQLVPPRTFATEDVVVTALLEPFHRVAGDAYDFAVDDDAVDLAVFDGVGHDLAAGLVTALALTSVRNARRRGLRDLAEIGSAADELLRAGREGGPRRFVTAVLARLERDSGILEYVLAGHPPPLLVRRGHIVKQLDADVQRPLGVPPDGGRAPAACEQLEPGDRLLFYSDGIVEARDSDGRYFGLDQLIDLTERAEQDGVSAPETLRRLSAAVLAHQDDKLQDDATLVMLDWSATARARLFPVP